MKTRWIVVLFGIAIVSIAGGFQAATTESEEKEFAATCPVSGQPAAEENVVALPKNGGNVYFCCPNCPKAFQADPAKFAAKLPARPETVEEWLKPNGATP